MTASGASDFTISFVIIGVLLATTELTTVGVGVFVFGAVVLLVVFAIELLGVVTVDGGGMIPEGFDTRGGVL